MRFHRFFTLFDPLERFREIFYLFAAKHVVEYVEKGCYPSAMSEFEIS